MKKPEVVRSYFHPTYPMEIVVVELDMEGKKIQKQILWNEVLDHLVTIPIKPLHDAKVLKKAEELVLQKVYE